MVPDHIWAPDFFGPQEIWALGNLGAGKFGSCMKIIIVAKFLGAQISWEPNFSGTKFLGDLYPWGPKKSKAQMRSGTISVLAILDTRTEIQI